MPKETSKAGPANEAAGAIMMNMPAPRMAAKPVAIASNKLSCGLREGLFKIATIKTVVPPIN